MVQQPVAQFYEIISAPISIVIVQMPSAQLLWNIKMSIFSDCIEKSRILWYKYLTVGIGPAKVAVWKEVHAVFMFVIS